MTFAFRPVIAAALVSLASPAFAQETPGTPTTGWPLPLTEEIRATSNEALQATLFDLIALKHAVHQEHWNAVGREFYQLHDLLGEVYQAIDPYIDMVAERKLALGAQADGRPSATAEGTLATERAPEPGDLLTSLQYLRDQYQVVQDAMYQRISDTEDDLVTQDLLIGVAAELDKEAWQIGAHLSTDADPETFDVGSPSGEAGGDAGGDAGGATEGGTGN